MERTSWHLLEVTPGHLRKSLLIPEGLTQAVVWVWLQPVSESLVSG